MSQKPQFVKNMLVPVEKFSLGERSGWRPRAAKRIKALQDIFLAGQFGLSCACGVTVLAVEDVDSCFLIDDGLSTVSALQGLKQSHQKG